LSGNEAAKEAVMERAALKRLEVGQFVRYCSEDRHWYDALITAVHGEPYMARITQDGATHLDGEVDTAMYPCVNLSFVSGDENAQDQYGRQMVRDKTSIMHYGQYAASGFFWCHPEDEKDAYKKMCEALKDIKS
jgi:hypothetical protein